ncbi:MAG: hypothetical protein R2822_07690 [Spirosomataceae bacterium]
MRGFLVIFFVLVGILGLVMYFYKKSETKSQNVTTPFFESHLTALQHHDYKQAYNAFSTEWQQQISFESYQKQWGDKFNKNGDVVRWELHDVKEAGNIFDGSTLYYCIVKIYFQHQKEPFWVNYQLETTDKTPLKIIHAGQKSSDNFVAFEVW